MSLCSRYVGDEYGLMSVLKYDPDSGQLLQLPYQLSSDFLGGEYYEVPQILP